MTTLCPEIVKAVVFSFAEVTGNSTDRTEGTVVALDCQAGYELLTQNIVKCRNGSWTPPVDKCTAIPPVTGLSQTDVIAIASCVGGAVVVAAIITLAIIFYKKQQHDEGASSSDDHSSTNSIDSSCRSDITKEAPLSPLEYVQNYRGKEHNMIRRAQLRSHYWPYDGYMSAYGNMVTPGSFAYGRWGTEYIGSHPSNMFSHPQYGADHPAKLAHVPSVHDVANNGIIDYGYEITNYKTKM